MLLVSLKKGGDLIACIWFSETALVLSTQTPMKEVINLGVPTGHAVIFIIQ